MVESSDGTYHKQLRYNQYQSNDLEVKPRSSKSASPRTTHRQRPAKKIDQLVTPDSAGIKVAHHVQSRDNCYQFSVESEFNHHAFHAKPCTLDTVA